MGNSSGKESRSDATVVASTPARPEDRRSPDTSSPTSPSDPSTNTANNARAGSNVYSSRANRGSRPDLSFLGLGGHSERDPNLPEPRRETKQEREKRRLEREWEQRKRERERSLKEENVDGGYLVTLGTYTGTEDFSKPVVRQLMIERRIAPFWRPLQDHEDTWTEHQLVAVARGLPLPPADEVPRQDQNRLSPGRSQTETTVDPAGPVSAFGRAHTQNGQSSSQSSIHSATNISNSPSSTPFFKGRAKAIAALKTSHSASSQTDMAPQEMMLASDGFINGQPIEALLYKDAAECPICFLYYPPYLNRTRCCDQSICSECFVQIKRPDPHPPEHHGDGSETNNPADSQQSQTTSFEEENMLVSEPAACPFCVQPEFGVSYDPPPFKRGLVYGGLHSMRVQGLLSEASSSSSLHSQGTSTPSGTNRRRGASLSANAPQVVTTDRVRPDWAKKLSDARSHALRRAAAATALHNAAYVLGNVGSSDGRGLLGRRRRIFNGLGDNGSSSGNARGSEASALTHVGAILAAADREQARGDALASSEDNGNQSERRRGRSRIEDIEELMMLEAIRLSLAEEENRRKKEEREEQKRAAKEEKEGRKREAKEVKKAVKEQKKADKAARKASGSGFSYSPSRNASTVSGLGSTSEGKGKAVDRGSDLTGMITQEPEAMGDAPNTELPREDSQRHLEQSRAHIQQLDRHPASSSTTPAINISDGNHRLHLRNLSIDSSPSGSFNDSLPGSFGAGYHAGGSFSGTSRHGSMAALGSALDDLPAHETPPGGGAGMEPMFNFRSLAAVIGDEGKDDEGSSHVEDAANSNAGAFSAAEGGRSRVGSGHSGSSSSASPGAVPTIRSVESDGGNNTRDAQPRDAADVDNDNLTHTITQQSDPYDAKHFGDISVLDTGPPPAPARIPRFPPTNPWANAQ